MTKTKKAEILRYLHSLKLFGFNYAQDIVLQKSSSCDSTLPSDINELKERVENCHLCELSKSRKNPLFSYGNLNSKIVFICDEPTKSEDELGSFYSGISGDMLLNMIEKVLKLKKEDVYITTLVKCRGRSEATIENFDSCSCYLFRQLDIVKPKIIVAFGERVFSYLLKDGEDFSQKRGEILNFNKSLFIGTYSTTFLLKNPSFKKEAFEDLLKIKKLYEEIN